MTDESQVLRDEEHLSDIKDYIENVRSGLRPACIWERLAVDRHINDLAKIGFDDYPYKFDTRKACRVINFIETLPHVKGHWAAKRGVDLLIQLEGWQKFNLAMLFGWVKKISGFRRYTLAYLCVPRKNGKSPIAAGIGLYMFALDGEYGAEVYCGATNEKQAWEVFRPAKKMVERKKNLAKRFAIESHAKKLERRTDGSRFEPVIGQPGDGASPHCAIHDEYHEHDDDGQFDTMSTGMVGRLQPLQLVITTAGDNMAGPCYALQEDIQLILQNPSEKNDHVYGMIYTIDPDDDWTSEQALIKANPNYGVSVNPETLRRDQLYAVENGRKQNTWRTKHLNQWMSSRNAWLNLEWWNQCKDEGFREDDLVGVDCYLGLDMSSKIDFSAYCLLFPKKVNGKIIYYCVVRLFLPEAQVQDEKNKHYQDWLQGGHFIQTDGSRIDHDLVEEMIINDVEKFNVGLLGFDPDGAEQITQRIVAAKPDLTRVEVRTTFTDASDPMKDLEGIVKDVRFRHQDNPVLNWMISNVIAKDTENGRRVRPVRASREKKIDGAVAIINALKMATLEELTGPDLDEFINDPIFI